MRQPPGPDEFPPQERGFDLPRSGWQFLKFTPTPIRRRRALGWIASGLATLAALPPLGRLRAGGLAPSSFTARERVMLEALADVVLPGELGPAGRREVVDGFEGWLRGYREGAEREHGYGGTPLPGSDRAARPPVTRPALTPPSPMRRYPSQLAALDREAGGRGRFAALPADARRAIVERAIVAAQVERLPPRPDGRHVAVDLMAYFFWSSRANDLCYRADIGRDDCRGLPGSDQAPRAWTP